MGANTCDRSLKFYGYGSQASHSDCRVSAATIFGLLTDSLCRQELDGYRALREHDDEHGDSSNNNANGEDGEDAADSAC